MRSELRQRGDEAERAGIGDRGDQFGPANPLHSALYDRVLDTDEFGKSRLDHFCPRISLRAVAPRGCLWMSGAGWR